MVHVDFKDEISWQEIYKLLNENIGIFKQRKELAWLGDATYQTPNEFKADSLLVWLEGQLITPEAKNGIEVVSVDTFKFKIPSRIKESTLVTCYYCVNLV